MSPQSNSSSMGAQNGSAYDYRFGDVNSYFTDSRLTRKLVALIQIVRKILDSHLDANSATHPPPPTTNVTAMLPLLSPPTLIRVTPRQSITPALKPTRVRTTFQHMSKRLYSTTTSSPSMIIITTTNVLPSLLPTADIPSKHQRKIKLTRITKTTDPMVPTRLPLSAGETNNRQRRGSAWGSRDILLRRSNVSLMRKRKMKSRVAVNE